MLLDSGAGCYFESVEQYMFSKPFPRVLFCFVGYSFPPDFLAALLSFVAMYFVFLTLVTQTIT